MPRIGYLASHYPAVAHAFLLREVQALRRQGVEVETFSIHRAPPEQLLAAADVEEAERTYAVLPARPLELILVHLLAALRSPARYLSTLRLALTRANPGLRGRAYGLFYFAEAIMIWRAAHRRKVRHLHAAFADVATDVALLATSYGGADWSWSIEIHGPVEFYDVSLNNLHEKLASARFATAASDYARSQMMAIGPSDRWDDMHIVRCGIDPARFLDGSSGPARSGGNGRHILCVGRLINFKGQSMLIEAFARLAHTDPAPRLTIVGDGPTRSELEALAARLGVADRVRFTGAVGQDEIRAFYRSADVFCLPSVSEGLPVVLMEALALGVPVVTTRIMGIPELVEHEGTGLLVAPGRVDALTAALQRLLDNPALGARLAEAGRRKVLAEFDVNASAASLRDVLVAALEA